MAPVVKNLPNSAGDIRDAGSIPGSVRSPAGGYGNPLQCSGLENPMDRGAWWATVHRVTKSWTELKPLNISTSNYLLKRLFAPFYCHHSFVKDHLTIFMEF